jgi:D-alanine-D-alanine ligase
VTFSEVRTQDPKVFGRVAVLMGGRSAEREISLKSGQAIHAALLQRGVDAHAVDARENVWQRLEQDFDRVFIALHGRGGEDGVIQGALETLDLPYTGSGVLGSALGMDKVRCKWLWQALGLPVPEYVVLHDETSSDELISQLGLPLMIKPSREGSSLGISKVTEISQLPGALAAARGLDDSVIAERFIHGKEYTCAILGKDALPLIRIETPRVFYDYHAKYFANDTRYICPCDLDPVKEAELQGMSLQAFENLDCHGWGRVDFMVDDEGRPWLIEVNTVPGMTDHSLVPMAARQAGISFDELVWRILEETLNP